MTNKRSIVLLAFGTNDLNKSAKRLKLQALESKYYTDIKILSSKDLDDNAKNFIENIIKKDGKKMVKEALVIGSGNPISF